MIIIGRLLALAATFAFLRGCFRQMRGKNPVNSYIATAFLGFLTSIVFLPERPIYSLIFFIGSALATTLIISIRKNARS